MEQATQVLYMDQIDEITWVAQERVTPGEFVVNVKNNPENNKYCIKQKYA